MNHRAVSAGLGAMLFAAPAFAQQSIDVEVRGELLPRGDDATVSSTALTPRDLDKPGASTADLLSSTPGVQVQRTGGSAELATVSLRGATSAETPVYLGPIALNDELTGTADLSTVPPFFLRRIEVLRGHAPIELEREGLAGAVMLMPSIAAGTRGGASFGAGSFGERFAQGALSLGSTRAGVAAMVRLDETRGSFEYRDDRGTRFDESDDVDVVRQNADARSVDLWVTARMELGEERGVVDVLVRVLSREQGVPGLGVIPAREARALTRQTLASASGDIACSDAEPAKCRLQVAAWGRASSYRLDDPATELLFGTRRQITDAQGGGARVGVVMKPAAFISVSAGGSVSLARILVDPAGAPDTAASRVKTRVFVAAKIEPVEWFDVRAEGAVASDALSSAEGNTSQLAPRGRVAAALRPVRGVEVFASAGRYVRVPTLGEQFGVTATVLGNPSLRSEAGWSIDAGARAEVAPTKGFVLAGDVAVFSRFASDLIAYEKSSFGALEPYNVGSARVLGLEASIAGRLLGWLDVGCSLTLDDPRDTSEGRKTTNDLLPFQARLDVGPRLGLHVRDLVRALRWDSLRLDALLAYRSSRLADPAGLIELPAQTLLDVEAGLGFGRGSIEITGRLSNLLDDRTTDLVGYPLPGRAGHLAITAWWK